MQRKKKNQNFTNTCNFSRHCLWLPPARQAQHQGPAMGCCAQAKGTRRAMRSSSYLHRIWRQYGSLGRGTWWGKSQDFAECPYLHESFTPVHYEVLIVGWVHAKCDLELVSVCHQFKDVQKPTHPCTACAYTGKDLKLFCLLELLLFRVYRYVGKTGINFTPAEKKMILYVCIYIYRKLHIIWIYI